MLTKNSLKNITRANYIKLGEKGRWESLCLKDGTLRLGYWEVPGDFHPDKGKDMIADIYRPLTKNVATANNHARQVLDFYNASSETLWITFSGDRLWWCQVLQPVEFIGNDPKVHVDGSRLRRTLSSWSDKSINGKVLNIGDLSGQLTRTAAYRGTICALKDAGFSYLMRVLQDQEHPEIVHARQHKKHLQVSIVGLIKRLTWQDFELLVDLIFANSGWRRISRVGGSQKTIDIEMILPVTGERAAVQVKSSTGKRQLEEYLLRFRDLPADKYFYVYHSSASALMSDDKDVIVMGPECLAENVLRAGLIDWLVEKAS